MQGWWALRNSALIIKLTSVQRFHLCTLLNSRTTCFVAVMVCTVVSNKELTVFEMRQAAHNTLPLGRTAALVPEFAVKDCPWTEHSDDDIYYIYITYMESCSTENE